MTRPIELTKKDVGQATGLRTEESLVPPERARDPELDTHPGHFLTVSEPFQPFASSQLHLGGVFLSHGCLPMLIGCKERPGGQNGENKLISAPRGLAR